MWILLAAILTASLLGSMHCVGMCGPLAIWASGADQQRARGEVILSTTMYHLGRLTTYALAGVLAGALGGAVDLGGELIGLQVAAAKLAGALMVTVGGVKLWTLAGGWTPGSRSGKPLRPSRIGGLLVRMRPYLFRLPPARRALATGLLTTLLPCGWLYLFALFAAGTGSMLMGPLVMLAFWIGTVPALTGLIAGAQLLSRRFTLLIPTAAALLLIITGCFTAAGRGFAELHSWGSLDASETLVQQVQQAPAQPLPCCVGGEGSALETGS